MVSVNRAFAKPSGELNNFPQIAVVRPFGARSPKGYVPYTLFCIAVPFLSRMRSASHIRNAECTVEYPSLLTVKGALSGSY